MRIYTVVCGDIEENCYIADVGEGKAVVIDPGMDGKRIFDEAGKNGLEIAAILLTHGHFDHIGGVEELSVLSGAPVCIHKNDLDMLTDPGINMSRTMAVSAVTANVGAAALSGGETLRFGDADIAVIHTPGHTPGSVCYSFGDDVFTGDTVFAVGYGRTDFPGGSFLMLRNSIRLLKRTISGKTIYPGHGESKIF